MPEMLNTTDYLILRCMSSLVYRSVKFGLVVLCLVVQDDVPSIVSEFPHLLHMFS
jgi:hypothetical protein